jgi:hypothetical protein
MYGHTSVAPRTLGKRWTGLRFVIEMFVLLHVVISKVASIWIWRISFVSHTRPLTHSKAKPFGRSGFRPASQLVVMRANKVRILKNLHDYLRLEYQRRTRAHTFYEEMDRARQ